VTKSASKRISKQQSSTGVLNTKPWWQLVFAQSWRLALTVALLYVVFRQVDLPELWQRLLQVGWWVWVISLVVEVGLAWLAGWRWALLTIDRPNKAEIHAFYKATMLGLFYNLFMPSAVGGDLVKWTALSHLQINKAKLVFTMILDRMMGMMGLVVWGFLGVWVVKLWQLAEVPDAATLFFTGSFAAVVGLFAFVYSPFELRWIPLINRISLVLKAESYLAAHKRAFLQSFGLGLVIQLVWLWLLYFLADAVGFTTTVWQFLAIQPVVSAVISLPVSFAGFGATEAGFLYFYQQLGQSASAIVALTSLLGVLRILSGLLGWMVGMDLEKKLEPWIYCTSLIPSARLAAMKLAIVLGTRPEIIKLSSLIRECVEKQVDFFILHTNQHYSENMDAVFFSELELPLPKYNLGLLLLSTEK
jgi:glycosyltransferase 2 family protein